MLHTTSTVYFALYDWVRRVGIKIKKIQSSSINFSEEMCPVFQTSLSCLINVIALEPLTYCLLAHDSRYDNLFSCYLYGSRFFRTWSSAVCPSGNRYVCRWHDWICPRRYTSRNGWRTWNSQMERVLSQQRWLRHSSYFHTHLRYPVSNSFITKIPIRSVYPVSALLRKWGRRREGIAWDDGLVFLRGWLSGGHMKCIYQLGRNSLMWNYFWSKEDWPLQFFLNGLHSWDQRCSGIGLKVVNIRQRVVESTEAPLISLRLSVQWPWSFTLAWELVDCKNKNEKLRNKCVDEICRRNLLRD